MDTAGLLAALDEGRLSGAALDVFEDEPLPADSPLRRHERLVISDHTAWYSEESQVELQRTAADAVATVCTGGLPGSLANPARAESARPLGRVAARREHAVAAQETRPRVIVPHCPASFSSSARRS